MGVNLVAICYAAVETSTYLVPSNSPAEAQRGEATPPSPDAGK